MKPASELPWVYEKTDFKSGVATVMHCGDYRVGVETGIKGGNYRDGAIGDDKQDSAYIVHACNAYPRLVEALRFCVTHEAPTNPLNPVDNARALLRELGEDK